MLSEIQPRERDYSAQFTQLLKEDGFELLKEDGGDIVLGLDRTPVTEFEQNREETE